MSNGRSIARGLTVKAGVRLAILLSIVALPLEPASAQYPPFTVFLDTARPASAHPDSVGDAAELPVLQRCGRPREPVGRLSGHGVVTYFVTRRGKIELDSIAVVESEGISQAGLLSVARRLLAGCRYRPARQAGEAVAVTVRHRSCEVPIQRYLQDG